MKHSFAPNPDLEICPSLRRSQSCWWGRQTQPGNGIAINKEQRDYSDMCLNVGNRKENIWTLFLAKQAVSQSTVRYYCKLNCSNFTENGFVLLGHLQI